MHIRSGMMMLFSVFAVSCVSVSFFCSSVDLVVELVEACTEGDTRCSVISIANPRRTFGYRRPHEVISHQAGTVLVRNQNNIYTMTSP
jgi:hypothetical protein